MIDREANGLNVDVLIPAGGHVSGEERRSSCSLLLPSTEVSLWAPLARVLGTSDPPVPSEDPERVASRLILRTLRSGPQRLPPRNYSGRGHASPWVGVVAVYPCHQVVRAMRVSAWGPRAGDEWCACTHATMPHLLRTRLHAQDSPTFKSQARKYVDYSVHRCRHDGNYGRWWPLWSRGGFLVVGAGRSLTDSHTSTSVSTGRRRPTTTKRKRWSPTGMQKSDAPPASQ